MGKASWHCDYNPIPKGGLHLACAALEKIKVCINLNEVYMCVLMKLVAKDVAKDVADIFTRGVAFTVSSVRHPAI